MELLVMIALGLGAGFLGGMFGVGGGILFVPAFVYFLKGRIPDIHMAIGTSLAIIVANSIAGTIGHAINGRVNWYVAGSVAVFAVIGGFVGATVSGYVAKPVLQRLFAVLLVIVAAKLFFSKPVQPDASAPEQAAVASQMIEK